MNEAIIDTLKTVADSTFIKVTTKATTESTSIWQDKAIMELFAVVGIIFIVLIGIYFWETIKDKKTK